MSEEQHEDLGAADDEASSSPAPKESTGGSSTPVGIATPPDEERETGKDDESGGLRSTRGVNGTTGSSSASEARPEAEDTERRTHVLISGEAEGEKTPSGKEEAKSEQSSPVAATAVTQVAPEGDITMSEEAAASKSKRKQELTLDLGPTPSSSKPPSDRPSEPSEASAAASASESGLIWQRVNMGTGDVQKKRQAFEQQIKSQTSEAETAAEKKRPPPVAAKPISKAVVARKIVGHDSPVGGGGLARSPAMREGFRSEDWVVKRTPINTPAADDGNKLVLGMINLSDEDDEGDERGTDEDKSVEKSEDETSLHLDSEAVFKSGATTPPEGGGNEDDSMRSSLAPSSLGFEGAPAAAAPPVPAKEATVVVLKEAKEATAVVASSEAAKTPIEELEPLDVSPPKAQSEAAAASLPFVKPPQGFGDSPEKNRQRLPGSKVHLATEQMQPEELLTAEQHAAATSGATLHRSAALPADAEPAKMTPLPSQSTSSSKPSSSTCSTLEKMRPSSSAHGHGRRSSGSGGSGSGVHGASN